LQHKLHDPSLSFLKHWLEPVLCRFAGMSHLRCGTIRA